MVKVVALSLSMANTTEYAAASPATPPSLLDGRITFAPQPVWADTIAYDETFPCHNEDTLTCLLHHEQIHAETNCTHVRIVLRLESLHAVQQLSHWRLNINPRTQKITLHTLKILRKDLVTEHAIPAKVRLVQREEDLVTFDLHEHYTLLTIFEDVRVGDLLDVAYTLEEQSLLFPGHCFRWISLPDALAIARYELSVLHLPERRLRHLASHSLGDPLVNLNANVAPGLIRWSWQGEVPNRILGEPNTPPWHLPERWLQLSDLSDWSVVSAGLAAVWPSSSTDESLTTEIARIKSDTTTSASRVELALRLIQDDFRYLRTKLEIDCQRPSPPAEVLQRRSGNSQDLARLLCHLLDILGVPARTVLVNPDLSPRLHELLPSPGLLNHAIVEFTLDGSTVWVDVNQRMQGGGPLGRSVPQFGYGLVIGGGDKNLLPQPAPPQPVNSLQEIQETIILDTSGRSSTLRVRQRMNGRHADEIRRGLAAGNVSSYQRERLSFFSLRYGDATVELPFTLDDDREKNLIRSIEIYRIRSFVDLKRGGGRCGITLPSSLAVIALAKPDTSTRQNPWSVEHPLKLEHTVELLSNTLDQLPSFGRTFSSEAFTLFLKRKFMRGHWIETISVETSTDTLPAELVANHARIIDNASRECAWSFFATAGVERPRRRHEFDTLLPNPAPESRLASPSGEATTPAKPDPAARKVARKAKRVAVRSGKKRKDITHWLWLGAGIAITAGVSAYFYYTNQ